MNKHLRLTILLGSLIPLLISPVDSANITSDAGAILTDVHRRVNKRCYIDLARHTWGEPTPGRIGDLLPEGTQVGTGNKSWAQISWPKVTTRIWEDSVVSIAPNKKIVYLLNGEMLFNLDKKHKVSESFEVWTKLLSARVHGTTFITQSTADFSRVTVLEGSLDVTNKLDNSIVHIGPGVVYEVRIGAPPPPTWMQQNGLDFNLMPKSSLSPFDISARPTYTTSQNNNPYTAPQQSEPNYNSSNYSPQKKYSDAEIEAKANYLAKGDPRKKQYYIQELQKKNPVISQPQYNSASNYAPARKYSNQEIEQYAEKQSGGNPQLKQEWLEKLHRMNGDYGYNSGTSKSNYAQATSSSAPSPYNTNYQQETMFSGRSTEPVSFSPIVPFVDTSEFAPIKTAKPTSSDPKFKNSVMEAPASLPAHTDSPFASPRSAKFKKASFVGEISSHAVPPISLFRTKKSATNLYIADAQQLLKHHLVKDFTQKLPSLNTVEAELSKLPPVCKMQNKFNNPELIILRNDVFAHATKITRAPDDQTCEVGHEMENRTSLPGQPKANKD